MTLATIQALISEYGYLALFVGTFMEGETFFILGGIAARQDLLNPYLVACTALAGGFIGDQVFFWLGLWKGQGIMNRFKRMRAKGRMARVVVRRHALTLMLLSRFLYGFRMVIPMACGAAGIHWYQFLIFNFISALLWTVCFGGLGYLFGGLVSAHMGVFTNLPKIILAVVLVMVISFFVGKYIRRQLLENGDK